MNPYISDDIVYIGQDDASLRLFESQYAVPEGMCYNSYVIMDEKIAIMDTSDSRTLEAWKRDLVRVLGDRQPSYLVVHHLEPDHASGIAEVMGLYPRLQVVCSAKAAQMMPLYFAHTDFGGRIITVKEKETLSLGRHTLTFFMAPMVHWPEVMVSYDNADKALFSADGFGKFGTYGADAGDWACEARRYYFNICGKYGTPIASLLKKASTLDIEKILPLHGPVLTGGKMAEALRLYTIWSSYGIETQGVFIAHASIHGCTREAALRLAEMLKDKGCGKVSVSDLCRDDQAEAVEDAFKYGRVVLAASSYDGGLFPPMHDFLHHLQIKAWQNRRVAVIENGSWAPSAARVMKEMLATMKNTTLVGDTVTLRGCMKPADLPALEGLADAILA